MKSTGSCQGQHHVQPPTDIYQGQWLLASTCGHILLTPLPAAGKRRGDSLLTGLWHSHSSQGHAEAMQCLQEPCSSGMWKGGDQLTWGMMVRLLRRSWRPIVAMSTSSMMIFPPAASSTRNRQLVREDFPAPVRPTTPTCGSNLLDQLTGL